MLDIDVQYDSSVTSLEATNPTLYSEFTGGVQAAVQALEALFSSPITVTIDVGYGEIDGESLGSEDLGESETDWVSESYSAVRSALIAENAPGSSTLPTTSPDQGTLELSTAQAKALGLEANNDSVDGYIGFSGSLPFSYTAGVTPSADDYYFVGVVEHEMTEVMGRVSLLNEQPHDYSIMDLYRWTSGVRDLTTGGNGTTAYFSINDGVTNLGTWNNQTSNGDLGDWYPSGPAPNGDDAFNDYSDPGVINDLSQSDVTLVEALGFENQPASQMLPPAPGTYNASGDFFETGSRNSILWQTSDGTPVIRELSGDSVTNTVTEPDPPTSWVIRAVGDFGNDGDDDSILWQNVNDTPAIWVMYQGNIVNEAVLPDPPSSWAIAGVGNFGGSTDSILWRNADGTVAIWQMSGTSITNEVVLADPPTSWQIAAVGNFGATTDSILWRNSDGTVAIWQMSGTSITNEVVLPDPPMSWQIAGVGNFGGSTDSILWQNTDGTPAIWSMQGTSMASETVLPNPGTGWVIVGTGDFESNGQSDIIFQNSQGQTQIWFMNGTQVASTQTLTSGTSGDQSTGGDTSSNGSFSDTSSQGAKSGDGNLVIIGPGYTTLSTDMTINSGMTAIVENGGTIVNPTIAGGVLYLSVGAALDGVVNFSSSSVTLFDQDQAELPDTVVGFSEGVDFLSFAHMDAANEASVIAHATVSGGNTTLVFPDRTSVTLAGVTHFDTGIFAPLALCA